MKKIKVVSALITVIIICYCCVNKWTPAEDATYVGSDKCASCHKQEFASYKQSDHFHAMDVANDSSVKGNFNNSIFIDHGDTSFFYKKNGKFYVKTTDSTGKKKEFLISYTLGWKPLQQYLIRFDDGRIQTLPFCWDTRTVQNGGQKWFHLYNKEKISYNDELFWMDINQNWNYMCADCHTTNFQKNFNLDSNRFNSSWNESKVSCESCHGPASEHIKWTERPKSNHAFKGFVTSLSAKKMNWKMNAGKQTLMPESVIKNDTLIETCARCHSRATRFNDWYKHGQSFLQTHIPGTIDPINYFTDGQIKEEDYEYGSFLQSKMYANGVTCMNCHDPHSMQLIKTGNSLCGSCHSPAKYDGPQHSFHAINTTGNECVNCHMPETKYMVIDGRRDHSIRIPRPDLSLSMGTPNACNKCHTDKTVEWASANFLKRHGAKLPKEPTYGQLLHKISRFDPATESSLYLLLQESRYPDIIKATTMEQYGYAISQRVSSRIIEQLRNTNPNIRLNAIKAFNNFSPEIILANIPALLSDPVSAVRMEAMNILAPHFQQLSADQVSIFDKTKEEYFTFQEQLSHRPEGFFNRAILLNILGNSAAAEQLYIICIQRFPHFIPAYTNLIDLYRSQEKQEEAKKYIDKGLIKQPDNAYMHYSLGLWLIRKQNRKEAMVELKKAATLAPENSQIIYGYAIGLFSTDEPAAAIKLLESFLAKYGNHPTILDGLISISHDTKNQVLEAKYGEIRKSIFGN